MLAKFCHRNLWRDRKELFQQLSKHLWPAVAFCQFSSCAPVYDAKFHSIITLGCSAQVTKVYSGCVKLHIFAQLAGVDLNGLQPDEHFIVDEAKVWVPKEILSISVLCLLDFGINNTLSDAQLAQRRLAATIAHILMVLEPIQIPIAVLNDNDITSVVTTLEPGQISVGALDIDRGGPKDIEMEMITKSEEEEEEEEEEVQYIITCCNGVKVIDLTQYE
uniref:Uncharacterized protein n=1 Tax=Moniliophthora roreri TaxID=221103 RepID=A0A0W0G3R9_MONRR